MAHLLIVEDDPLIRKALVRALTGAHSCATARNGAEAMAKLSRFGGDTLPYDLIISDVDMPLMTGLELYRWVTTMYPSQSHKVVFYTGSNVPGLSSLGVPIIRKALDLKQTVLEISGYLLARGVAPRREVARIS